MSKSAVAAALLVALAGIACGSGSTADDPSEALTGLAARAERVGAALDAGRCDAALAEARELQIDLAAADLAPAVRSEALAGAASVANGIVCAPPPPTTTSTAVAAPASRDAGDRQHGKKGKGRKGDDDDDD